MLRSLRLVAWALVALVATGAGWIVVDRWIRGDLGTTSLIQPVASIGGPFSLTDTEGKRFTEKDLQGKPTALFFGFTFCPDVCPTTLLEAGNWLKALGPDGDRLRVVFVTVDPERDTAEQMKLYLSSFDPRIIGLTGTPEEIAAIVKAYRVYARKVPTDGGGYTMEHTASVYVLDAKGQLKSAINYKDPQDQVLTKLKAALAT